MTVSGIILQILGLLWLGLLLVENIRKKETARAILTLIILITMLTFFISQF